MCSVVTLSAVPAAALTPGCASAWIPSSLAASRGHGGWVSAPKAPRTRQHRAAAPRSTSHAHRKPARISTGADVVFYVELARKARGPLVELAIGNGRVAIPVAQATGQRVIGIDSSPAMLEQARARAAEAGVELNLRRG